MSLFTEFRISNTYKLNPHQPPFWKTKALTQMSHGEWESLCDGCGLCCLQKFEDKKTGRIDFTNVACYLLDIERCRCRSYAERAHLVKGCLQLTPEKVVKYRWLPKTCAYRLLAQGKDLKWWHPLVSNDPEAVHRAGISARERAISEEFVHPDDVLDYIIPRLHNQHGQ